MIIKFHFNSKSSGQGVPEAISIAEKCKASLEKNFYVVTFDSLQDFKLEKLVNLVGGLKGSVVSIDNGESISAKKFFNIIKCPEKLTCKGICSHIRIGYNTIDQFLMVSESSTQDRILYTSNENTIKELSEALDQIEENRFRFNKSLFLSSIQKGFETEKKFCNKFDIEKIKEKINEFPDELQLEEEEPESEEDFGSVIEYVLLRCEIDSKMPIENMLKCSKVISLITTFNKSNQLSDTDIWLYAFPLINQYALVRFAFLANEQDKLMELKNTESEEDRPIVVSSEDNLFFVHTTLFNLYFQLFNENDAKIGDCIEQLKKTKEKEPKIQASIETQKISPKEGVIEQNYVEIEESQKSPKQEVEISSQPKQKDSHSIEGTIKGETTKALKIMFSAGEVWIPKSSVLSEYDPKSSTNQSFVVEDWVLKKNNLV